MASNTLDISAAHCDAICLMVDSLLRIANGTPKHGAHHQDAIHTLEAVKSLLISVDSPPPATEGYHPAA